MPLTPLNVCFVWHMHQPDYKDHLTGQYQMPWVRLHGVKDYLDMVVLLKKYPAIRQTFNIVPSLMDQLEDYATSSIALDRYQAVTLQSSLTPEDRLFILERFFDANADRMVARSPYYMQLLTRRNQLGGAQAALPYFTDVELFDLTMLFHLVWTDPLWFEQYPQLQAWWQQGQGFSAEDRAQLLQLHQHILQQVLPVYKQMQDSGQIEVTVTPYYHPILPLLVDTDSALIGDPAAVLPAERFAHPEDAMAQLTMALAKYEHVFGCKARGVWPSEQSVSPKVLQILAELGLQWTISSEGVLAKSIGVGWDKDEYGSPRNITPLVQNYDAGGVRMVFRHLTLSDLIGFHYQRMHPTDAVNDLLGRLKHIQHQLTAQGVAQGTVTIALDGENCWEGYEQDGHPFLHQLYQQLSAEPTFNVCTISEALQTQPPKALPLLHTGSWIEDNFKIWIGDPLKNQGWQYLVQARQALVAAQPQLTPTVAQQAWKELYIAQGSDWFWWYGEPHDSGQDDLFDDQFRLHVRNIYQLINQPIPDDLYLPIVSDGTPVYKPQGAITPTCDGYSASGAEWQLAGRYECARGSGAMHQTNVLLRRFYYGSGNGMLYLRLECDRALLTPMHSVVIYVCNDNKLRYNAPLRLKISAAGQVYPLQYYGYAFEIALTDLHNLTPHVTTAEALADHLWVDRPDIAVTTTHHEVIDVAIPLEGLKTPLNESCSFTVAVANQGVLCGMYPGSRLLGVQHTEAPKPALVSAASATH
jgi:alpha-amylase/alpha-mannosidase (GH57 family)